MRERMPSETESRNIIFASPKTGTLFEMTIAEFVIMTTMETLEAQGMDVTPDTVSAASSSIAASLSAAGWFTNLEYQVAWAENEMMDADSELEQLVQHERQRKDGDV